MSYTSREVLVAAQIVDAVHDALGYLMGRLPEHFDAELESCLQRIAQIVECRTCGTPEIPRSFGGALDRNFTVAQCAILLQFAHQVAKIANTRADSELAHLAEKLWLDLKAAYLRFFVTPPEMHGGSPVA